MGKGTAVAGLGIVVLVISLAATGIAGYAFFSVFPDAARGMTQASTDMHNLAADLSVVARSVNAVGNAIPVEILFTRIDALQDVKSGVYGVGNTISQMSSTANNIGDTFPAFRDSISLGLLTLLALGAGGIIAGAALVVTGGAIGNLEKVGRNVEPSGIRKPSPVAPSSIPLITSTEGFEGAPSISYGAPRSPHEESSDITHSSGQSPPSEPNTSRSISEQVSLADNGQSTLRKVGGIVLLAIGGAFLALTSYSTAVTYISANCPSNSEYCREFFGNLLSPTLMIYLGIGIGVLVIGLVLIRKRKPVPLPSTN